jgi:endoglucanase
MFATVLLNVLLAMLPVENTSQPAMASPKSKVLPKVEIEGNHFTTEGKTIRLRGVSISDPDKLQRAGHWNIDYLKIAKDWGSNIVRIPVHTYTWRYHGADAYLKMLDEGVDWAKQLGMYVIIDWHAIGDLPFAAWPGFNYMTDWKETCNFWHTMANHYKGNSTVALFELFNEPESEGKPLTWNIWRGYMEQLVDTIRSIDKDRLCAVGGMNWAYELNQVIDNPVKRPGIAYVTHPYPNKRNEPWEGQWEKDFGHVAKTYPVIATELGFVVKGDKGEHVPCISDEHYGRKIIDFMKARGISYTVWCLDPSWAPALLKDFKGTPSDRQGVFFKNELQKGN